MARTYNIPIFDISVDEDGLGLFGLSFVDNPAIQVELHAFKSEEKQKIYFSSHEKREVVSPVLIPNQLIIREADGIPYYMRASEDTIKKIYEKYMLSGNWNNFTYMHENMELDMSERAKDGIYLQRLWIIDDEKKDDANCKYGFDLPKGTLMMKAKVMNRQIWNEIKEGKLRGISLEAFFDKISTNKALQITYSKMKTNLELFQKFIAFLNEVSVEAEDLATEAKKDETNSGEIELKYYLDDVHYFVVDQDGYVRDENGEKIEEGSYKLADGNVFTVDSNGKFVATEAVAEEEDKVEAPIAETFEEKEEDEKDKEDVEEPQGEDGNDSTESDAEDVPVGDEKDGEVPAEEDDKRVSDDDEKLEEEELPEEELPIEEEPKEEEKPLVNALPYEINGVEYLLPAEVIEYIESLKTSKIEVEEKLTKMSEQTPSASPIGTVVKTSEGNGSDINGRIASLSMFKGFTHRI